MGKIKDRNGMDLTEGEDIKKRWQEYTDELGKQIVCYKEEDIIITIFFFKDALVKKIFMTQIIMIVWSLT